MLLRVKNKITREIRKWRRHNVPFQQDTAFPETGTNWYEHIPLLAGPSTFIEACSSHEAIAGVLEIMKKLTADQFVNFNMEYLKRGMERYGNHWRYADINTVLYGISKNVKIEKYLEIGVRRGRSMAMVASVHSSASIVGFDMWIPNYVGIENPGPDFVRQELARVGYQGQVNFVRGNSRDTVPRYFREHPREYFDLITVDGDHTAKGARIDLKNVIPRLKVGGILVFDDIINPHHVYLKDVWDQIVTRSGRFLSYSFNELGYGVAFAIKKY